ncbi:hypothetical protein [Arthrobacter sp. HLT1-21]
MDEIGTLALVVSVIALGVSGWSALREHGRDRADVVLLYSEDRQEVKIVNNGPKAATRVALLMMEEKRLVGLPMRIPSLESGAEQVNGAPTTERFTCYLSWRDGGWNEYRQEIPIHPGEAGWQGTGYSELLRQIRPGVKVSTIRAGLKRKTFLRRRGRWEYIAPDIWQTDPPDRK